MVIPKYNNRPFIKVSSDAIFGDGATLIYKLLKMNRFRAPQSSVVQMKAVLWSGITRGDFSEVHWYSGVQVLFVTVF